MGVGVKEGRWRALLNPLPNPSKVGSRGVNELTPNLLPTTPLDSRGVVGFDFSKPTPLKSQAIRTFSQVCYIYIPIFF